MKKKIKSPKPPSRKVKGIINRKKEIEKSKSIDYRQHWAKMIDGDKEELVCCGTCKWIALLSERDWCRLHLRTVTTNEITFGCSQWNKCEI